MRKKVDIVSCLLSMDSFKTPVPTSSATWCILLGRSTGTELKSTIYQLDVFDHFQNSPLLNLQQLLSQLSLCLADAESLYTAVWGCRFYSFLFLFESFLGSSFIAIIAMLKWGEWCSTELSRHLKTLLEPACKLLLKKDKTWCGILSCFIIGLLQASIPPEQIYLFWYIQPTYFRYHTIPKNTKAHFRQDTMGALLGVSCKPSPPQKKYTAEARDKLVEAGDWVEICVCWISLKFLWNFSRIKLCHVSNSDVIAPAFCSVMKTIDHTSILTRFPKSDKLFNIGFNTTFLCWNEGHWMKKIMLTNIPLPYENIALPDQTVRGSVFDQGVSCTRCMMVEVKSLFLCQVVSWIQKTSPCFIRLGRQLATMVKSALPVVDIRASLMSTIKSGIRRRKPDPAGCIPLTICIICECLLSSRKRKAWFSTYASLWSKITVRGTMVRSEVCNSWCFCLES